METDSNYIDAQNFAGPLVKVEIDSNYIDAQNFAGPLVKVEIEEAEDPDELSCSSPTIERQDSDPVKFTDFGSHFLLGAASHSTAVGQTHSEADKPCCAVCGKVFKKLAGLQRHNRSPCGERIHVCQQCGKSFYLESLYKEHFRVHTGERPFACPLCDKTFSWKTDLMNHRRTHSSEKPHSCEHCGKTFALKGYLNKHLQVHTGERPFVCSVCDKTFSRKAHLDEHVRIHTGAKPFPCHLCPQTYAQSSALKKHVRAHTASFSCEMCDEKFKTKLALRYHKPPCKIKSLFKVANRPASNNETAGAVDDPVAEGKDCVSVISR